MRDAIVRTVLVETLVLAIGFHGIAARAEEAGTGHYIPGATSDFIDMLPDRDSSTFLYANAFTYYHGSANAGQDIEFGGRLTADAKGTVYSDTSLFLYQSPWKLLGGQYGAEMLVPYVWLSVEGDVSLGAKKRALVLNVQDAANVT